MYCPPIDRERFREEFEDRYSADHDQKLRKDSFRSCKFDSAGSRLLWIVLRPKRVLELVRRYYMVGNLTLLLQVIQISALFHLFLKATIHTFIVGSNEELIKYTDSIYYPRFFGYSKQSYIYNRLIFGYSVFFLIARIFRVLKVVDMSLKNSDYYSELRVSQLTSAYLASFHLSFKEWVELFKYTMKHECCVDSNLKETNEDHLKFNKSVQHKISKLLDRDAIFYVNPIDFDKCFEGSVLPSDKDRMRLYKEWHFASPINRISTTGLMSILTINFCGLAFLGIGCILVSFENVYLELRSEFPEEYSPSFKELIDVAPSHYSDILTWIRSIEALIMVLAHALIICDSNCSFIDLHITTARVQKIVNIFEKHVLFSRQQTKIYIQNSNLNVTERQNRQFYLNIPKKSSQSSSQKNQSIYKNLYPEYNNQIRRDIALIRLIYREFLNVKRHNTSLLVGSIVGEAICVAFMVPLILTYSEAVEHQLVVAALTASLILGTLILFYCARLERSVSIH